MGVNERDKFLTEAMGYIWNEEVHKARYSPYDDKYWMWFGKLWEWATVQTWLDDFMYNVHGIHEHGDNLKVLINPDKFADAVYDYLKKREAI